MNLTHLHLLLNHVPVIGTIFGILIFIYGFFIKSTEIKKISFYLFIISALVAIPVYLTGEQAEETVEHLPGVLESLIEKHEDSAKISMFFIEVMGLVSFVGSFLLFKSKTLPNWLLVSVFVLSLLSSVSMAQTANLGGKIRHTEIQNNIDGNLSVDYEKHDEDDD